MPNAAWLETWRFMPAGTGMPKSHQCLCSLCSTDSNLAPDLLSCHTQGLAVRHTCCSSLSSHMHTCESPHPTTNMPFRYTVPHWPRGRFLGFPLGLPGPSLCHSTFSSYRALTVCYCDKIPDINNLKGEMYLAHSFRGLIP
jgi:hypothetical protein